ncbi:MAG: RNase adapter RapZ [Candidatus Aminicenantes bacterium]|nr:RNase adapter RapZ [Candidatus Aminicenantes bacterium]
MKDDRFLIITGLSGSGKTVVSRFLEDIGYYCIDNLPSKLIPNLVEFWTRKEVEIEKIALVVDIREVGFSKKFPEVLKTIRKKISPRLIFLEASDEALVKRFSESRRPHPLARKRSVMESVKLERKRLAEIKRMADEVIDTTSTNISQIKEHLTRKFFKRKDRKMQIMVVSFGYKYGIPLDSDLVFDTRFLPNPFYIDELRNKTGKSPKVREFVLKEEETRKFLSKLYSFVDFLIPRFIDEGKSILTISTGCTGGKHRSVILAEKLKGHIKHKNYNVRIYHRDLFR